MTRSRLDGDGDGCRVLGLSLVNCRQMAIIWPLCPHCERAEDGRQLIFQLHENQTYFMRVGLESKRLTPISGKHLNQA